MAVGLPARLELGDIEKFILTYHWEADGAKEKVFEFGPFRYDQSISFAIPSPGTLQRLFFEVSVIDRSGNKTSSGARESLFLTSQIPGETYMLRGANLVLGDYDPQEQDKVYKWFTSYLKMAREAEFVPIEGKRPYFVFLGKGHEFIKNNTGPHFLMYTPAPFSPSATEIHVHRYFLSYWYGPGWNLLPEEEVDKLGDGLLLGKGRYTLILKYLQKEDFKKFANLLGYIGEGRNWPQSLKDAYGMSIWEAQIRAIWFAYGNVVLAVLIIIGFAWLGKSGLLLRAIGYFRRKK